MQTIQREHYVTRDYEFGVRVSPRRISRERIVASHVRVNDLNIILAHESRQRASARRVKRVSQRKCRDT